jgi:transcriptional regulator with XRE-family HTH domain
VADKRPGLGFDCMSPDLARNARTALSLSHKQLGREIGERAATVMRYEIGKPVEPAVVDKLRAYFQGSQVRVLRNGRVGRYQTSFRPCDP